MTFTTPSLVASKLNSTNTFGLVDKFGKKLHIETPKVRNLMPDESLYKEKMTLLEKERDQRRKKETTNYKNLSQEEKNNILKDMEQKARVLDFHKTLKTDDKKDTSRSESRSHKPEFLKNIDKDVYAGKIDLAERIRRNHGNSQRD